MPNVVSIAATTIHPNTDDDANQKQNRNLKLTGELKELFSNEKILDGLKTRDKQVIKYVYKRHFQQIRQMILSNSGSPMDAEDVFLDAMIVIYQRTLSSTPELTCSFSEFLYEVCRKIWNFRHENSGQKLAPQDVTEFELPDDPLQQFRISVS